MSAISEHVKKLREYHHMLCDMGFPYDCDAPLIQKTADIIEELSAKLEANSQPSLDQWVPCSERLPDEDGRYYVTVWDEVVGLYTTEWNFHNGRFTPFMNYREENIKAWRPRPEPYKEEE